MFKQLACPRWLTAAISATAVVVAVKAVVIVLSPTAALEAPTNYEAWGLGHGADFADAFRFLIRGGLLAPIAEEAIFRGAFLGSGWALLRRIRIPNAAAFWCAAIPVSLLFVCLHETANPTFIWIRMSGALALAWVYRIGGLRAAVAMHAIGNSFWASLIIADTFFGYDGMLAVIALAAMIGCTSLRRSQSDFSTGREPAPELEARPALSMALILLAGSLSVGGSPLYTLAAVGLLGWSAVRLISRMECPFSLPYPIGARP